MNKNEIMGDFFLSFLYFCFYISTSFCRHKCKKLSLWILSLSLSRLFIKLLKSSNFIVHFFFIFRPTLLSYYVYTYIYFHFFLSLIYYYSTSIYCFASTLTLAHETFHLTAFSSTLPDVTSSSCTRPISQRP